MRVTRSILNAAAVPARTGAVLLARVRMGTGQLMTRASISAIAYTVSDLTAGAALGAGTFATTTVSDSLVQNDPRWRQDSASELGPDGSWGYNWAAALPASLFALSTVAAPGVISGEPAPTQVQCDVAFTPASGETFRLIFRWLVLPTYG